MNTTPNSQNFPQFSQGTVLTTNTISTSEIADFCSHPAIQNRPYNINSVEQEEHGILLTFGTTARKAVLSYTHETSLYLYNSAPTTTDSVYLHIHVWSDDIFRVVFSKEKEIKNPFEKLPKETQMLIGEPKKADYTLTETDTAVFITTKTIEIKVNKETTKISAKFLDGNEFFSQKKYEFQAADAYDLGLAELDGNYACFEALDLEQDELIYGLGERFDSLTTL